jgi:formamidopyrimidine-DNA glycosylase
MPELPEVETIARLLRPVAVGHRIAGVEVLWPRTVDRPPLSEFHEAIQGVTITDVTRRGKFIVVRMDSDWALLVHLRMSGRFVLRPPRSEPSDLEHTRAIIHLENGQSIDFIDPRKFGRFYLVRDSEEVLSGLGPEPLGPNMTAERFTLLLRERRGEIKRLLLNQQFVAGMGNIYASEILWQAGIHPQRRACDLTELEGRRLYQAMVSVLRGGIKHGGTSLEDRQYVYPNGDTGDHQEYLRVYDRAGEVCQRCGYEVQRIIQGQRSTYYCPVCQPVSSAVVGTEGKVEVHIQ